MHPRDRCSGPCVRAPGRSGPEVGDPEPPILSEG
uniref:Uncharacterized protein n=1 Tax=Arundo donax TaxID=35708 RepID=A0A0A8ZZS9_ARUDO